MVRAKRAGVLVAAVVLVASVWQAQAGGRVERDDVIVVLRDGAQAAAVVRRHGVLARHLYGHALRGFAGCIPPGLRRKLAADPDVAYIEHDLPCQAVAQTLPTGVNRIEADLSPPAADVDADIAIIDTGIDLDHPDLNVVYDQSFIAGIPTGDDDNGHGTHVAGTAAARDNDLGVVGVAPGARLWALKVLRSDGYGSFADVIAAIDFVTANAGQIEVANLSLGGTGQMNALWTALRNSVAAGVVYVVAAGNDGRDVYGNDGRLGSGDDFIPAAYPEVAAISAMCDTDGQAGGLGPNSAYGSPDRTIPDDTLAWFTDYSQWVVPYNPVNSPGGAIDLAAPGVDILSTYKEGGYATGSGTSMASPHVAGAAARLIATYGRAGNAAQVAAIRQALIDSAQAQAAWGPANTNDPDTRLEGLVYLAAPSAPVVDPNAAPVVAITTPADGSSHEAGQPISFSGSASDDGADLTDSLVWVSSLQGQIGTGGSFSVALNDGDHTITAYATDAQGKTGYAFVTISVVPQGLLDVTVLIYDTTYTPRYYFQDGETVWIDVFVEDPQLGALWGCTVDCEIHTANGNVRWAQGTTNWWGWAYFDYVCDAAEDGVGLYSVVARASWFGYDHGVGTGYFEVQGGPNQPPSAQDDAYSVAEDSTLTVPAPGVLGNDSDPEGDPLTAIHAGGPSDGSLSLNADGSFTYTPDPDFSGTDSFAYRANDGQADSNLATVTITVSPINDPPVAEDQQVTTDEDTAVAITLGASDPDNDPLTYTVLALPAHGALSGSAPALTYTPDTNYDGPDNFTFQASDGELSSNVATVSITVNPVNDPPVADDDSYSTEEDVTLNVAAPGVLDGDTDVEGSALTAISVAGPSSGGLTLNADGSFTYAPNANFNGADSFTYRANDGQADSNLATVSITVTPVNDPPVAVGDQATTEAGTPVTIAVLANDSDPEGDSLSIASVTQGTNGSVVPNPDDTVTYTPNAGFAGPDTFTYKASDGSLEGNEATVAITVLTPNQPPVADAGPDDTADEGSIVGFDGSGSSDPDGEIVSYEWDFGDGATAAGQTATHAYADDGVYTVTLTVTDGQGATGTDTAAVTILNVAPTASAGPDQTANEGDAVVFAGSFTDPGSGDTHLVEWDFGDGATAAGALTPTHTYADNDVYTVTFTASDDEGGEGQDTLLVTVNNVAPAADAGGPYSGTVGEAITFTGSATDPGAADTLTYTWDFGDGSPPQTGHSVTHAYVEAGPYTATLTVTDDDGASDDATAAVTVQSEDDVSGTVAEPSGSPVAGLEMKLYKHNGRKYVTADVTTTDDSGDYAFNGLEPGGRYKVKPNSKAYVFSPEEITFDFLDSPVDECDFVATPKTNGKPPRAKSR